MNQERSQRTGPVRVLIGGESAIGVEGLRRLLLAETGLDLVGTAYSPSGVRAARELNADILLVEARIEQALSWCDQLAREDARPWILLMGIGDDDEWAMAALEAGAKGVLSRSATPADLVKAIHVVHEGQIWALSAVVARLVGRMAVLTAARRPQPTEGLSPREQEVLRLTAEGLSNNELASRLGISRATVKVHLTRIYQKLGVRDRVQLVVRYNPDRAQPGALERRSPPDR